LLGISSKWIIPEHKAASLLKNNLIASQGKGLRQSLEEDLKENIIKITNPKEIIHFNRVFTIPKKDGSLRRVIDCRAVNNLTEPIHFKMDHLSRILESVYPGDWFTSLDIHAAYSHIKVDQSLQPFLAFSVNKNIYIHTAMPFGLSRAPYIFTKILHDCLHPLQVQQRIKIFAYIDDILIISKTYAEAESQVNRVANHLTKLGFLLAEKKCIKIPTQTITFLGWQISTKEHVSIEMTARRKEKMIHTLSKWIRSSQVNRQVKTRSLAKLIGRLNFLRSQMTFGAFHLHRLDRTKNKAVARAGWNSWLRTTPSLLKDLLWWHNQISLNVKKVYQEITPQAKLTTDASKIRWGRYQTFKHYNIKPEQTGKIHKLFNLQIKEKHAQSFAPFVIFSHFLDNRRFKVSKSPQTIQRQYLTSLGEKLLQLYQL
ncbi:MAG: putative Transposon Tf2-6 polyprotein, partial [Streblomastix strix]